MAAEDNSLEALYRRRLSRRWRDRLIRALQPPAPFVTNPAEPRDVPLGEWNLYIGGAGRLVEGYVNLDLFAVPGVSWFSLQKGPQAAELAAQDFAARVTPLGRELGDLADTASVIA